MFEKILNLVKPISLTGFTFVYFNILLPTFQMKLIIDIFIERNNFNLSNILRLKFVNFFTESIY
jgi:hypothetical protein